MLDLQLPEQGKGKDGLLQIVQQILKYSVNTWDQGFMDKLYSTTNAVGVISEYLLAILNTNVHVYQVSPVLTLIEKHTTRALAELVGFEDAPHMGGIAQPGGSASNSLSILVARNTKFPCTKTDGYGTKKFVLFTSEHGHYSVEKAAQMFGFGSHAVQSVPVDDQGRMVPAELTKLVKQSRQKGETPFYVNATAGTTVLGSFDPFEELAKICKEEDLWLHVDGSYGGSIIFSEQLRKERMRGLGKVDSFAITPHKMLGVPVTCSFLIGRDMRQFYAANAIEAEYLFHQNNLDTDIYDLGHFTPQCGRKGDALKLFLGWLFYGREGYAKKLDHAYEMATYLHKRLSESPNFVMVSQLPLPCVSAPQS
jgi:glutamate/tyrosine decarboxylase-like PLP-dependent enzyme